MRIVFFGTPEEAVDFLEVCRQCGDVVAVVTAPDRPRGRGRKLKPSPVKVAAEKAGIDILQPASCKEPEFVEAVRRLRPDVIVVVAFGQILPPELIAAAPVALNVHFSLLPQLRGAAPVQRAVQWGFGKTGVTVQLLAPEVDAGAVVCQRVVPIHQMDDAAAVRRRIVLIGVECLRDVLEGIAGGRVVESRRQTDELATRAPKIERWEGAVDFREPAGVVAARVMGLADSGGAYCLLEGKRLKLWRAAGVWRSEPGGSPGEIEVVVDAGPLVCCGGQYLVVMEAQLEGKRRMSGPELVRGRVLEKGKRLEAASAGSGRGPGG